MYYFNIALIRCKLFAVTVVRLEVQSMQIEKTLNDRLRVSKIS